MKDKIKKFVKRNDAVILWTTGMTTGLAIGLYACSKAKGWNVEDVALFGPNPEDKMIVVLSYKNDLYRNFTFTQSDK